jgi:hypothetical protein
MESNTPTRSLEERLDSNAEAWRPKPGDKLIGVVVDIGSRTTEYGTYAIVTLRDKAGDEYAIHAFHTVLANEFAKRPLRLGERVGVKYLGKSDKGYQAYTIAFEDVIPPDWQQAADDAEAADADFGEAADEDIPL